MTPVAERIATDFEALPPDDAVELFDRLVVTLHRSGHFGVVDDELRSEIRRRINAFESGESPGVAAEDVFSRIESRFS